MTRLRQVVSALWELPQNLLGALVFAASSVTGSVRRVDVEDGRLIVEAPPLGISLGSFVFYNGDGSRYFPPDPLMRQHEVGHTFQSRRLGPLYLPLVGLPSSARALYGMAHRELTGRMWSRYFDGYPERWADRLGGISADQRSAWKAEHYDERAP